MMHRLLFWLAYRLQDRLLEDALNANAALIREVNALRRERDRRAWLDRVDSERRAVRILGATKPRTVPPLTALGWANTRPYHAPTDGRRWGRS